MQIIELELDLKDFFLVASFRFGCDFFFYKKLEVEDLHESFPGFAFLILIIFFT